MKKLILILLCLTGVAASYAQQSFTVKAKISNPHHYTLYLSYNEAGKWIIDTTYEYKKGTYIFKGSVAEPVIARLGIKNCPELTVKTDRGFIPGPALSFVLENTEIHVKGRAETIYLAAVKGGKGNKEWNSIRSTDNAWEKQSWNFTRELYSRPKGAERDSFFKAHTEENRQRGRDQMQLHRQFIHDNPHSILSMYFLRGMLNILSVAQLQSAFDSLAPDWKNSAYGQPIANKLSAMQKTAVGMEAIPIDKKDINGNPVNLSTLKGKYVLVDFWGSWCGPCRHSHPHLKELYAKYHSKGLEILGIAQENGITLEACEAAWKKAIQQDGLPWLQVLNNQNQEKFDAVKAYGITGFPTKILLDKEGRIIGRYIGDGGTDFDKKLNEIFGF